MMIGKFKTLSISLAFLLMCVYAVNAQLPKRPTNFKSPEEVKAYIHAVQMHLNSVLPRYGKRMIPAADDVHDVDSMDHELGVGEQLAAERPQIFHQQHPGIDSHLGFLRALQKLKMQRMVSATPHLPPLQLLMSNYLRNHLYYDKGHLSPIMKPSKSITNEFRDFDDGVDGDDDDDDDGDDEAVVSDD